MKPILLYNTYHNMLEPMDATHPRHLQHILAYHHPTRIKNERLYNLTKIRSSLGKKGNQLKLLRYILQPGDTTPNFQAGLNWYTNPLHLPSHKGRTSTSLATLLDRDLSHEHKQLTTLTLFCPNSCK